MTSQVNDPRWLGGFSIPVAFEGLSQQTIGDKMINPIISHSNQINNTKPDQWRVHLADWFNVRAFRLRRQAASVADPVERKRLLALSRKMATAARRAGGSR